MKVSCNRETCSAGELGALDTPCPGRVVLDILRPQIVLWSMEKGSTVLGYD